MEDGLIPVITPNTSSIPITQIDRTHWIPTFHGDLPMPVSLVGYPDYDPNELSLKYQLGRLGGTDEAWKYSPNTRIYPQPPPIPPPLPTTPILYIRPTQEVEDEIEAEPVYFDPYFNYRGQTDIPLPLSDKGGMLPVTCTFGLMKARNLSFVSQEFRWDGAGMFKSAFESQLGISNGLVFL